MLAIANRFLFSSVLFFSTLTTFAAVRLPAIISDNMVLQQKTKVALWGWADAGEKVSITTGWNNQTSQVTANSNGKWMLYVLTGKAGGPYSILFTASNQLKIDNVLLGEVWLASGQSNMEFFMGKTRSSSYTGVLNYDQEIKAANFPMIRQVDVANKNADEPQADFRGNWKVCSPQTVDTFSAVAYYFARQIHLATGFPVGIINSTWGGTAIESWMKKEVLTGDADFKQTVDRYDSLVAAYPNSLAHYKMALDKWKSDTTQAKPVLPAKPNPDKSPFRLYNAMIAPLVPYTLAGLLWYQGESNAGNAIQYKRLFPAMISNWRSDFKNNKLPVYFVQISPHRSQNPMIREAQLYTYRTVQHAGMAVTTDNGDSLDIHPRNKKLVGERLSLWALHNQYGKTALVCSGPLYKSMKVVGKTIRLKFDYTGGGLVSKDGKTLTEFTIAGADRRFVPAKAEVQGDEVVVSADGVQDPVAVRFAWRNIPDPNFFNKAGLPASPFRTDNW